MVNGKRITTHDIIELQRDVGFTHSELASLLGVYTHTIIRWKLTRTKPTGATRKLLHILIRGEKKDRRALIEILKRYNGVVPTR